MPMYAYWGRDARGNAVQGRIEVDSERDGVVRLRKSGLFVVGIELERDIQALVQHRGGLLAARVTSRDLALFVRQFATMLNAGLPIVRALRALSNQAAKPKLQRAITAIVDSVEAGGSLGSAFAKQESVFPHMVTQAITAADVGGIMDDVLKRLADQLEREETIRQKVRSALVYPIAVTGIAFVIVMLLMIFVVPNFVQLYQGMDSELPLPTRILIAISDLLRNFWWLVIGLVICAGAAISQLWRTEEAARLLDWIALKIPVFGPIIAKSAIARFSRNLAGLTGAGIPLVSALGTAERTVGNRVIAEAIRETRDAVLSGRSMSDRMGETGVFPPMVLEMVSVGEQTGNLDGMLEKVADAYEEDVLQTTERLSSLLEPMLIVILGGMAGLIILAMMLPILNLYSEFSKF